MCRLVCPIAIGLVAKKERRMKKIYLLIALTVATGTYAQQALFSNRFNNLALQDYTTASSSVKFTNVPSGYSLINDGLKNNIGSLANPNKPFNEPSLKTTGWAVVYNPIENDTFLVSTSWLDTTNVNVNRWVITPLITNITANSVLTWMAKCPDASYRDGYEVYGTTNTGNLTPGSFAIGDRLFALEDGNSNNSGEKTTWTRRSLNLGAFAGSQLRFAFRNTSKDLYQLWIDDVEVLTLNNNLDAGLTSFYSKKYILTNSPDSVQVNLSSLGATAVSSVNLSYQIGNSSVNTENFTFSGSLNYKQGTTIKFAFPYTVSQANYYTVKTWINSVNGVVDQNLANDTVRYSVTIQASAPAKAVLVEQFTSAHNVNGADAEDKVLQLQSNSVIVVNVHHDDSLTDPTSLGLKTDYKKESATALIDRYYFEDLQTITVERPYYQSRVNKRAGAVSPAAVSIINKSFNPSTRLLTFTVKADFVGEVKGDYRLNAYLTENRVTGPANDTTVNGFNQWNGLYNAPWSVYYLVGYYSSAVNAYILNAAQCKHHNTLIHSFDGSYGLPGVISSTGSTQGQSYQQTYTLTVPTYTNGVFKYNADNLYLVGFVAEYSADKNQRTVLNAVKEKVTTNGEYVSIKEIAGNLKVSVFPNPTSGELFLDTRSFKNDYTLSVLDAGGRKVIDEQAKNGSSLEKLDLSALPSGIYFLKISSGGKSTAEKVLIQKNY